VIALCKAWQIVSWDLLGVSGNMIMVRNVHHYLYGKQ